MVSLALHEPYVHAGHILNLNGPQVPIPAIKTMKQCPTRPAERES